MVKIPKEIEMKEEEFRGELERIISQNYGQVRVGLRSVLPIDLQGTAEGVIKKNHEEVYEISTVVTQQKTGEIQRPVFYLKRSLHQPFERDIALLINNIMPTTPDEYSFAKEGRTIQIFPKYLSFPGPQGSNFDMKGLMLWEDVRNESIMDQINPKEKVQIMDLINSFNPLILLHEKANQYLKVPLKKVIQREKNILNTKGYTAIFVKLFSDFYGFSKEDRGKIKPAMKKLVHEHFMKEDMLTFIHNKSSYHNHIISLINPSELTIGPRCIDLGSLLGNPTIVKRYIDKEFTIHNLIEEGYEWKRRDLLEKFNRWNPNEELKEFKESQLETATYLGAIYSILKNADSYNQNRMELDEVIKDHLKSFKTRDGSGNSQLVYSIVSKYKPLLSVAVDYIDKGKGDK